MEGIVVGMILATSDHRAPGPECTKRGLTFIQDFAEVMETLASTHPNLKVYLE